VQNMLKPPTTLFHPKILWQVLKPQRVTTQSKQRAAVQEQPVYTPA